MADKSFFGRLRRLFSSTVVVRNVGGRKLKIADTDGIQSYGNVATNFLVDRYLCFWHMLVHALQSRLI